MTSISVIVPVFNGASTIGRAIDSLGAQTWTDFEVVVVNDGSTDQTEQIVQALAEKDARIRLVTLAQNSGVGCARNAGIDQAKGEWIALLDADDWFDADRLELLMAKAIELKADIVLDNLRVISQSTGQVTGRTLFGHKSVVEEISPQHLFERDTPFASFAIGYAQPMFRTAFLREKKVRYNESYALGEDFVFLACALLHGAKVYSLPSVGYNYAYGRRTLFSPAEEKGKINRGYHQILTASDELLAHFSDKITPELRKAVLRRRHLFQTLSTARDIKFLVNRHAWQQAFTEVVRQPSVIPFVLRMMLVRYFSPDYVGL